MIEIQKINKDYQEILKIYDFNLRSKFASCSMEKFNFCCSNCGDCDQQDNYNLCWSQYLKCNEEII